MNPEDLAFFNKWFIDYSSSFYSPDKKEQGFIALKIKHTFEVCKNVSEITGGESFKGEKKLVAETAGLFHDLGRFQQYARYKTFRDSISVNHGRLGAEILSGEGILQRLNEDEQALIINTVKFHNAASLPVRQSAEQTALLKLIRDADKLDIWRVFLEFYESGDQEKVSEAGPGLPDTEEYSAEVISDIFEKRTVNLASLRTLNDFKLMQLSWVFDLNFKTSFGLLLRREYIGRIFSCLPQTEIIREIEKLLHAFAAKRLGNDALLKGFAGLER